ncbi:MAG: hypothetical protein ACR2QT_00085 [Woeseiaceae bacterium]
MITSTDCCHVAPLLPFLKTLFDIALLRKGPEHIPRSIVLLLMAVTLWLFAVLTQLALIDQFNESDFALEIFSALIAITCYSTVVIGFGQAPRLTQTITAILGCGAILAVTFVFAYTFLLPFVGRAVMALVVWFIVLWSVSIKGHIIASAINRHWYLGLAIAVSIFVLQHVVHAYLTAP